MSKDDMRHQIEMYLAGEFVEDSIEFSDALEEYEFEREAGQLQREFVERKQIRRRKRRRLEDRLVISDRVFLFASGVLVGCLFCLVVNWLVT